MAIPANVRKALENILEGITDRPTLVLDAAGNPVKDPTTGEYKRTPSLRSMMASAIISSVDTPARAIAGDATTLNRTLAVSELGIGAREDKLLDLFRSGKIEQINPTDTDEQIAAKIRKAEASALELISPGKGDIVQAAASLMAGSAEAQIRRILKSAPYNFDIDDPSVTLEDREFYRHSITEAVYELFRSSNHPAFVKARRNLDINSAKKIKVEQKAVGNQASAVYTAARAARNLPVPPPTAPAGATTVTPPSALPPRSPIEEGKVGRIIGTIDGSILEGKWNPVRTQPVDPTSPDQLLTTDEILNAIEVRGGANTQLNQAQPGVIWLGPQKLDVVDDYNVANILGNADDVTRVVVIPLHELAPDLVSADSTLGIKVYEADIIARSPKAQAEEYVRMFQAVKARLQEFARDPAHPTRKFVMPSDDKIAKYLHRQTSGIETSMKQFNAKFNADTRSQVSGYFGVKPLYQNQGRLSNVTKEQQYGAHYLEELRRASEYVTQEVAKRREDYQRQYIALRRSYEAAVTTGNPDNINETAEQLRAFLNGSIHASNPGALLATGNAGLVAFAARPIMTDSPTADYTWEYKGVKYYLPTDADIMREVIYDMRSGGFFAGRANRAAIQMQAMQDTDAMVSNMEVNRQVIENAWRGRYSDPEAMAVREIFLKQYQATIEKYSKDQLKGMSPVDLATEAANLIKSSGTPVVTPTGSASAARVSSLLDEILQLRDLALIQKTMEMRRGGAITEIIGVKTGYNKQGTHITEKYYPSSRAVLLNTMLTINRLDRATQAEAGSTALQFSNLAHNLYFAKPGLFDMEGFVTRNEYKRGLQRGLLRYMNETEAFFMTRRYLAEVDKIQARTGFKPGTDDWEKQLDLIESAFSNDLLGRARKSDKYRTRQFAETTLMAKAGAMKDFIHKSQVNPLTFDNYVRGQYTSLLLHGAFTGDIYTSLLLGAVANPFMRLIVRPFVPGANGIDFFPLIGSESALRKQAKELLPHLPDFFGIASNYFLFPEAQIIKNLETSLTNFIKVRTHLWHRTNEGQLIPNYRYVPFYRNEMTWNALRKWTRKSFDIARLRGLRDVGFFTRFGALLHSYLSRREERKNGGNIGGAIQTIVIGIGSSLIGAIFERLGEYLARMGVDEFTLFKRFRLFMDEFNSSLAKSVTVGEGFFAASWGDLTGWGRVGKVVGSILRGGRIIEQIGVSGLKGAIRGGLWGGLTLLATGGNWPLAWTIFGLRGGHVFLTDFTKLFTSVEKDGSISLTSWARMGQDASASGFKKFFYRYVNAFTDAPAHYTMAEVQHMIQDKLDPEAMRRAEFQRELLNHEHMANPNFSAADYDKRFADLLAKKDIHGITYESRLHQDISDHMREHLSPAASREANEKLLYRYSVPPAEHGAYLDILNPRTGTGRELTPAEADSLRDAGLRSTTPTVEDYKGWLSGYYDSPEYLHDKVRAVMTGAADSATTGNDVKNWDDVQKYSTTTGQNYGDMFAVDIRKEIRGRSDLSIARSIRDVDPKGVVSDIPRDRIAPTEIHIGDWHLHLNAMGGGHGFLRYFHPAFSTAVDMATAMVLLYNVNPGLAVGAMAGVGLYEYYLKDQFKQFFEERFVKPFQDLLHITNDADRIVGTIVHAATKSVDILWYVELSKDSGPIAPLMQGISDTTQGLGQAGQGIGEMIGGNEAGFGLMAQGLLQASLGAFNVAGIGFGISAVYGVGAFAGDAVLSAFGASLPDVLLGWNPVGLAVAAVFTAADILTGGAVSRFIADELGKLGSYVWANFLGPALTNIITDHLGAALFATIGATIGSIIGAFIGGVPGFFIGMGIGSLVGWAVYTFTPVGDWINSMFDSTLQIIGLLSFFISFILLFRRRTVADVIIGVILMIISLAEIGVLAALPVFNYNEVGYGTLTNANCIYPQSSQTAIPGACTQGNGGTDSSAHQTTLAADIAPSDSYAPVIDADGQKNYIVLAPIDGTIVEAANNQPCGPNYTYGGYIKVDMNPAEIGVNKGINPQAVTGTPVDATLPSNPSIKYGLSDVEVTIVHVYVYQYILDRLKQGPVYVQKGEEIARLVSDGRNGTSNDNMGAPNNPCWTGDHAHVEVSYYNTNAKTAYATCPAYNAAVVFDDPAVQCSKIANCSISTTFGCTQIPVNGDYEGTPVPSSTGVSSACPLSETLMITLKKIGLNTNAPAALLAAELEYQNHLASPGVPGSTKSVGAGALFNTSITSSFSHYQTSDTYNSHSSSQPVANELRQGATGLFDDISGSKTLQSQVEKCTGRSTFDLTNVEDDLYATGLVFNDFANGKTKVPIDNSLGCSVGSSTSIKSIDPTNATLIYGLAQNYVCRGAQDGTSQYTSLIGNASYPSCGINEAQSIADLTGYFNANCFGGPSPTATPTPTATITPTPSSHKQ